MNLLFSFFPFFGVVWWWSYTCSCQLVHLSPTLSVHSAHNLHNLTFIFLAVPCWGLEMKTYIVRKKKTLPCSPLWSVSAFWNVVSFWLVWCTPPRLSLEQISLDHSQSSPSASVQSLSVIPPHQYFTGRPWNHKLSQLHHINSPTLWAKQHQHNSCKGSAV